MTAAYIEVAAAVRYWEDATVNGAEDKTGDTIPFRVGDLWCPVFRLADGEAVGWPHGTTADAHYKVCDAGRYWLQDADRKRVALWRGDYVPDAFLCHGDRGYGDYIILTIDGTGMVAGWVPPVVIGEQWERI